MKSKKQIIAEFNQSREVHTFPGMLRLVDAERHPIDVTSNESLEDDGTVSMDLDFVTPSMLAHFGQFKPSELRLLAKWLDNAAVKVEQKYK